MKIKTLSGKELGKPGQDTYKYFVTINGKSIGRSRMIREAIEIIQFLKENIKEIKKEILNEYRDNNPS